MKNLQITNSRFITYTDDLLTVDVLGGVDLSQVERMVCTLRITYNDYPPQRTTLDLYNDNQTDKLQRTLCDKWGLKLLEASRSLSTLTLQLEEYRLQQLRYTGKVPQQAFSPSEEDRRKAVRFLSEKNLSGSLTEQLNTIGILGEDRNALILFLALASHKSANPFSVLCLAKSGIGKSYILQKLSECMPDGSFSFHSRISANALYYFDSGDINGKVLFVEDLEWTTQMLQPLATLQTQGRLVNTRATKDKDGMLHSTTFEVVARLCLIACAYSDKNFEELGLPFLCLHLNHSPAQDLAVMEYQKKCRAGQIRTEDIARAQHLLKCVIASLQNISVVNPYATLINLPQDIAYPRKSLLLLLNFIEAITFFFQYQRERLTDTDTGEIFIRTHPQDIEMAFALLKNTLFRRADELSTSVRGFYKWLTEYLQQAKTTQFTALDTRKTKPIHPRTLNRYLQELKLFSYIQVAGGNKHREGFIYKLTDFGNQKEVQGRIEQEMQATLKDVWNAYRKEQNPPTEPEQKAESEQEPSTGLSAESPQKPSKRKRIDDKEEYTLKLLLELEARSPDREYIPADFTTLTGRSQITEARYLKRLWQQGKLKREWKNRQYYYTLAATGSKTVSQSPMTDPQTVL